MAAKALAGNMDSNTRTLTNILRICIWIRIRIFVSHFKVDLAVNESSSNNNNRTLLMAWAQNVNSFSSSSLPMHLAGMGQQCVASDIFSSTTTRSRQTDSTGEAVLVVEAKKPPTETPSPSLEQ